MSEEKQKFYYIQHGYIGNAVLWWAKDGHYTTEIEKAAIVTEEGMKDIMKSKPNEKFWSFEYVDGCKEARKMIIDSQYLSRDMCIMSK
jgi:hypothetical protein